MASTTNKGQEDSNNLNTQPLHPKNSKIYQSILKKLVGLTHKEGERILFDLLAEIKNKAVIKS